MTSGDFALLAGYSADGDGGGGVLRFTSGVPSAQTITAATGTPIVITTAAAHGLVPGQQVMIAGVNGNGAANGTWAVGIRDTTSFSLNGSTSSGTYTSGGWVGDGGTVIPSSWASPNQGLWTRIPEPTRIVPITQFGPMTSAPLNYAAIVSALKYLQSIAGGTLYFQQRASSYDVRPLTSSGLSVTVNATNKTYTRSSGSFLDDGFAVGHKVSWSGFPTAANNVQGAEITSLSATVMTHTNVTGLATESSTGTVWAPIELAFDEVTLELAAGAILNNTSTAGADFFLFGGTGPTRQRVNFSDGTIRSGDQAGHIFTFANVGIGLCTWTSEMVQQNVNKSILYWGPAGTSGGLYSNVFGGPHWGHGTGDVPPSLVAPKVPAVFVQSAANIFNANAFVMQRVSSHHGEVPFFWLVNDGLTSGPFWTRNKIDIGTVEQCSYGFIYVAGHLGLSIGRLGLYDLDGTYGHLIETAIGAGGRSNEQCLFDDIEVVSVDVTSFAVGGVRGPRKSVTTLTASGTTATLTSTAHGYKVGDSIFVRGANEAAYDGRFPVATVPSADTLTYTMGSSPSSPATGTITVSKGGTEKLITAGNLTSSGTTATLNVTAHGYAVGQRIYVEGVTNETAYNGRFTVASKTTNSLTYEMGSDPANNTATGVTMTVADAAMTIKLSSSDLRQTFGVIGGNADLVEVDANNNSVDIHAENARCLFTRVSTTVANRGFIGTGGRFDTPKLRTDAIEALTSGGLVSVTSGLTASGVTTLSGETVVASAERTTGIISPTSLSGSQNDWAPTGVGTARVVRIDSGTGLITKNITGLSASQTEGRRITLMVVNTTGDTITLPHNSASSTAANRFYTPGGTSVVIPLGGAVELMYDATSSRWRILAKAL